jgi:glycolate oxidase iron-sulfur subunit
MDLVQQAAGAWDEHRPPDPELIRDCVHCGFCLPTCPSYAVFGDEMDSPRGRILLMRVGHEPGERVTGELHEHFDRCLGCMACVTACPSGVRYDRLIEQTRPQLERHGERPLWQRAYRSAVFALFMHPGRMRALGPFVALSQKVPVDKLPLGERGQILARLAPPAKFTSAFHRTPHHTPARGTRRGTVALLQGCVQRVFFGDVNAATARVLAAEGFEVHTPRLPRCCGSLMLHAGVEDEAKALAKDTIERLEGYEHVVANVAGCGSGMKDYAHLLSDEPGWEERARTFSAKVRDVHELLAAEEPRARRHPLALRVAYHDACHLAHAQQVRAQPRALLRGIPGLEVLEPTDWELCCGSAGIYNLMQPAAAAQLGRRKARNLDATGADAIAAANPGCAIQIAAYLERRVPIFHPITLLDHAIRGTRPQEV